MCLPTIAPAASVVIRKIVAKTPAELGLDPNQALYPREAVVESAKLQGLKIATGVDIHHTYGDKSEKCLYRHWAKGGAFFAVDEDGCPFVAICFGEDVSFPRDAVIVFVSETPIS